MFWVIIKDSRTLDKINLLYHNRNINMKDCLDKINLISERIGILKHRRKKNNE